MKPDHLSDVTFASLNLHPRLLSGLEKLGYGHCTPIQAACLPRALAGQDLAGQAQTGTGKTAAFLLATMQHLLTNAPRSPEGVVAPGAFMLAPTRELAVQIYNDAKALGADTGLSMTVCYGGAGYEQQRAEIERGVDILIGTPGRLIDFYKQKLYTLDYVEIMVLDEADRMFDLGFIDDIRYLLRKMPPPAERKSYLFSATLSHRVLELAFEHMKPDVQKIEIEPEQVTAERVKQALLHISNSDKLQALVGLLRQHDPVRTLVFVNTKRDCEQVENALNLNGFEAATLSGDVAQTRRLKLLQDFKDGKLPILVATDVAARGLHISGVTHVINFDLPQDAADYVHRIGRTARAGAQGDAISFCCESYVYSLPDIENYIGMRIPALPESVEQLKAGVPYYVAPPRPSRDFRGGPRRGGGGGRPGGGRGGPRRR
ncbi:DEAD/DEAH box helicase [Stagnimonas aquatica]|uniref:ATP-dependent RNA helicase RhlB n=1 Tax=Stagnimonas aquatica TaxID=2689987 RepID=A0A3N0VKJ9_9GAMM|nr:DEAD/DEAH box helicase [Stagnimonas aquatica]ROH93234.1 DEAD/DEAH box helicase [Stagnimonas aquatica]